MILDKTEYRLDEQIRKCILMLETKWEAKNIEFDLDLPKQMYYGSESLLEQVWMNVIDNAVKHSKTDGVIQIKLVQEETYLAITITDYGDGMTEEVQKHIFEKVFPGGQLPESRGKWTWACTGKADC